MPRKNLSWQVLLGELFSCWSTASKLPLEYGSAAVLRLTFRERVVGIVRQKLTKPLNVEGSEAIGF